jgi:predicted nucleic acid-binding protein
MERIIIDTNIVIQWFKNNSKAIAILDQKEVTISFITVIELLSFLN